MPRGRRSSFRSSRRRSSFGRSVRSPLSMHRYRLTRRRFYPGRRYRFIGGRRGAPFAFISLIFVIFGFLMLLTIIAPVIQSPIVWTTLLTFGGIVALSILILIPFLKKQPKPSQPEATPATHFGQKISALGIKIQPLPSTMKGLSLYTFTYRNSPCIVGYLSNGTIFDQSYLLALNALKLKDYYAQGFMVQDVNSFHLQDESLARFYNISLLSVADFMKTITT